MKKVTSFRIEKPSFRSDCEVAANGATLMHGPEKSKVRSHCYKILQIMKKKHPV